MQYLVDNHTQRAPISGAWENTPNSLHPFGWFSSSVAGRVGLLQAGDVQEELQDSIKIVHNSDQLENCSARNRMQFGAEKYAQAGLMEQTGRRVLQKQAVG